MLRYADVPWFFCLTQTLSHWEQTAILFWDFWSKSIDLLVSETRVAPGAGFQGLHPKTWNRRSSNPLSSPLLTRNVWYLYDVTCLFNVFFSQLFGLNQPCWIGTGSSTTGSYWVTPKLVGFLKWGTPSHHWVQYYDGLILHDENGAPICDIVLLKHTKNGTLLVKQPRGLGQPGVPSPVLGCDCDRPGAGCHWNSLTATSLESWLLGVTIPKKTLFQVSD